MLFALLVSVSSGLSMNRSEALKVIGQCDSAQIAGQPYTDSVQLALAARTLRRWRILHSTAYAEACYHYGRQLRMAHNEEEAMQWFIRGSHTKSRNYSTKARIMSNMGSMAHLAGEFDLSYDMFEHSAAYFLRAGDSLMYYYALCSMAFELAEQALTAPTLTLLSDIERANAGNDIQATVYATKAALYTRLCQYDSVVYYTGRQEQSGGLNATGLVLRARSLWHLGQYDSAHFYATQLMQRPDASPQDKYNMLYILANSTDSCSPQEAAALSTQRLVLDKDVIDPEKIRLTAAVNLLRQDLNLQKRRTRYLVAGIAAFIGIFLLSVIYLRLVSHNQRLIKKRLLRKSKLIAQQLAEQKDRQQELLRQQEALLRQNSTLRQSKQMLQNDYASYRQQIVDDIENTCSIIRDTKEWKDTIGWKNYESLCDFANRHFYLLADKLRILYNLSEREVRLCMLVLIHKSSNTDIADLLYYSKSGIRNFKHRIAHKLGCSSSELRPAIINLIIGQQNITQTD